MISKYDKNQNQHTNVGECVNFYSLKLEVRTLETLLSCCHMESIKGRILFQAACDVFCVGDDVNIEKANDALISNDRSWKKNKFRLTYTAEAPSLTEGK